MIHAPACSCIRCCRLRVEQWEIARREEIAGRERAYLEAVPHRIGRAAPGSVRAIEERYGAHARWR